MHKGRVVSGKRERKVIDCEGCGFRHLHPLPSEKELEEFYARRYFGLIRRERRAPEMKKLMKSNKESARERKWLAGTLYADIDYVLKKNAGRRGSLIDIGCGTGDCLRYMKKAGWDAMGIEPSEEVPRARKKPGAKIYNGTLEDFIAAYPERRKGFDAAVILNVLEHVLDPGDFLKHVKKLLKPATGIACIRVPNDFSPLQKCAREKMKRPSWWIAAPDHVNYFNRRSIARLLRPAGFKAVHITSDFPMELFLLMGEDYVARSAVGKKCHEKRMNFELSLPDDMRRNIYRGLAELDIGRDLLVFAKVRK